VISDFLFYTHIFIRIRITMPARQNKSDFSASTLPAAKTGRGRS
jgi:hypothetical protein